jgi:hypothetical protein
MKPGRKTFMKLTGITYNNAELKDFIGIAVVRRHKAEMAKAKVLLTPTTTLHVSYIDVCPVPRTCSLIFALPQREDDLALHRSVIRKYNKVTTALRAELARRCGRSLRGTRPLSSRN